MRRSEYIMLILAAFSVLFVSTAWYVATDPAYIEAAIYIPTK